MKRAKRISDTYHDDLMKLPPLIIYTKTVAMDLFLFQYANDVN